MNVKTFTGLTILLSLLAIPPAIAGAEPRELLLAAYSVPKEAYEKRIIPAFVRQWKQKTGETIQVRSSFRRVRCASTCRRRRARCGYRRPVVGERSAAVGEGRPRDP
jgi:ABC-type sulfate transport system substrate-binding protein